MDTKTEKAQAISDLLCSAFEGGSNYWYRIEKYVYPPGKGRKDVEFPHIEVPSMQGGALLISADDHWNPKDKRGLWRLDPEALERGWNIMVEKHPRHYADAMEGTGDAATGDVFLQLCLFGDLIFG